MRQPWRKCWVARRQRGFAVFPRPNPAILHPGCPHSRRTGRGTVRGWPVQLPSKSIVALSLCEFAERVAVLLHDFAGNLHLLRSEEHTSELQSRFDIVCRLLLEKK